MTREAQMTMNDSRRLNDVAAEWQLNEDIESGARSRKSGPTVKKIAL